MKTIREKLRRAGRPKGTRNLVVLTFKADRETLEALRRLQKALVERVGAEGGLVNGGRSQVIRKAIRDAAAQLADNDREVTS